MKTHQHIRMALKTGPLRTKFGSMPCGRSLACEHARPYIRSQSGFWVRSYHKGDAP